MFFQPFTVRRIGHDATVFFVAGKLIERLFGKPNRVRNSGLTSVIVGEAEDVGVAIGGDDVERQIEFALGFGLFASVFPSALVDHRPVGAGEGSFEARRDVAGL